MSESTTPPSGSPPASISSPMKKSRWSRVGTVMRRSSTAFSIPGIRAASPTPSERDRDRDSDSASIKGTSKPPSLKQLDTLSAPAPPSNHATPSPIAESPAREAASLAPEHLGPSPLAAGVINASPASAQVNLEPPAINEIPPTPGTPAREEQTVITSEPEQMPTEAEVTPEVAAEHDRAPSYSSQPPEEAKDVTAPPSIKVEDTSAEQKQSSSAAVSRAPSQSSKRAPSIAQLSMAAENTPSDVATVRPEDSTGNGAASYFTMPTPQPIAPTVEPTKDYAAQVWGGPIPSSRDVSTKPSTASLATSYGWSHPNGNEYGSNAQSTVPPHVNPFADPQPHDAAQGISPTDTIHLPEPFDPRSPRDDEPVIAIPLPTMHNAMNGQTVRNMASGYDVSTKSTVGPGDPSAPPHDERIPLLAASAAPQYGQITPSVRSNNTSSVMPRMFALGWIEYVLPDAAVYYVHPTMHVTTDIDLRNLKQLEIVTAYLERNGEGFKVPQGCELWLRDAAEGKRRECVPIRTWIDHTKREVSFELPTERAAHHHEDDKLDGHYRYWSFMEAHPAHSPLSLAAHAEAADALTWTYTDRLLPLSQPVPPPFTQEECQELMTLLRSFGTTPDNSGMQTIVHTRIVSRILLRVARWRQTHFRPHRPLPHDAHKASHGHHQRKSSFVRAVFDFIIGVLCLGIPYLFVERSHQHRIDEESGLRAAGPILVIGASSCLAAAIVLSATVSFMSFPGLDDVARVAGFVAILCSTASMTSAVIALFRYKADMDQARWHYDMSGAGATLLTKRSVVMSLPLVFLAYALAGFVTGIVIYSFRSAPITPPGFPMHHYSDYTKWTVVGTLGGLAGVLAMSVLLSRQ